MPIVHETGRIVVTRGLDQQGDQSFGYRIEDMETMEAWAILQQVADRLHACVQDSFAPVEDDDDD